MSRTGVRNLFVIWLRTFKMYQNTSTNIRLIAAKTAVLINRTVIFNDRIRLIQLCGVQSRGLVMEAHSLHTEPSWLKYYHDCGDIIEINLDYNIYFSRGISVIAAFSYRFRGVSITIDHWADHIPTYIRVTYQWNKRTDYPINVHLTDDIFADLRSIILAILTLDIPEWIIQPLRNVCD